MDSEFINSFIFHTSKPTGAIPPDKQNQEENSKYAHNTKGVSPYPDCYAGIACQKTGSS